jgi:hypothetical protein
MAVEGRVTVVARSSASSRMTSLSFRTGPGRHFEVDEDTVSVQPLRPGRAREARPVQRGARQRSAPSGVICRSAARRFDNFILGASLDAQVELPATSQD